MCSAPGFVGAHGVWLTDDDIRMLADTGYAIAHNPGSNLRLGCGIAPVRELLNLGVTVGLGTDGSVCADNQNLFEALRIASVVSTIRFPHETSRWLDARTVWDLATAGSARVLGVAGDVGAIAPNRKADLVLLRADSVFLRPFADPVNALVYAETGASVDTVLVDGRDRRRARPRHDGGRESDLRPRPGGDRPAAQPQGSQAFALAAELAPHVAAACRGCRRHAACHQQVRRAHPAARVIRLDGVSKTYRTRRDDLVHAIEDVTLSVGDNEFVAIVGASGCGKRTLLNIVAGLSRDRGRHPRADSSSARPSGRRHGLPEPVLLPWRTVSTTCALGRDPRHGAIGELREARGASSR